MNLSTPKINKVIVIDDDNFYLYALEKLLRMVNYSHQILPFSKAQAALDYLSKITHRDQSPEMIFFDTNMPQMDGWEFLDQYSVLRKKLNLQGKLYMMSASNFETDVHRAKQHPYVCEFLIKPIKKETLYKLSLDTTNCASSKLLI